MTTWVERSSAGRDRGMRGIARAWVGVMIRPRQFFQTATAPADQAPALTFAMFVTGISVLGLLLTNPGLSPVVSGSRIGGGLLIWTLLVLVVTPVTLHLTAAIGTLPLLVLAPERAGISETVQLIGYSSAPIALAWVPGLLVNTSFDVVVAGLFGYSLALLVIGVASVHRTGIVRAFLAAFPPVFFAGGIVTVLRIARTVVIS